MKEQPTSNQSAAPREITLTEGVMLPLSETLRLGVRGVMYAHLSGSDNNSMCVLLIESNGVTEELTLDRRHSTPPTFIEAHGWRIALVSSDPYQQPSRVQLLVQPL